MKKWDLLEKFEGQHLLFADVKDRYQQNAVVAEEKLASLKANYDAKVTEELQTGKDLKADKDKIRKSIRDAIDEYDMAIEEEKKMMEHVQTEAEKARITSEKLYDDYVNNYRPAVIAEEVQPIIDRLENAKAEYFNCLFDLYDKENEYLPIYSMMREMTLSVPIRGVYMSVSSPVNFAEIKRITGPELSGAQSDVFTGREFPKNLKRVKGAK